MSTESVKQMRSEWPECFRTGVVRYEAGSFRDAGAALADAGIAWAMCQVGSRPPACFGDVMIELAEVAGKPMLTPDNITAYMDEWLDKHTSCQQVPEARKPSDDELRVGTDELRKLLRKATKDPSRDADGLCRDAGKLNKDPR